MDLNNHTAAHPNKQYPTPPPRLLSPSPTNDDPPNYTSPTVTAPRAPLGLGLTIPEKHWTSITLHSPDPHSALASNPHDRLLNPRARTRSELISLSISRSRFVLRLISLIFSCALLGCVCTVYTSFYRTKGHKLMYAGEAIWPDQVAVAASNVLLAAGAVTATVSALVLVAGLGRRWRRVTKEGDSLALAAAVVNFCVALAASVVQVLWSGGNPELRRWTCAHQDVRHPEAEFESMCAGLTAAEAMAWGVVAVEVLVMVNVGVGYVLVRRNSEGRRRFTICA
ncbi:hypothetical protein FN846DRAFT_908308 [Sphaerosporella brunnea]|uniref:Uncharacterized protein n=1 Tax=Sphaerosporella brunnea TaxID=1250544 RepID=A0A5J5ETT2_9PEZI|nr:hypothetical protein FN846DRAFT_908308 [Sphaerosporella brunnea]